MLILIMDISMLLYIVVFFTKPDGNIDHLIDENVKKYFFFLFVKL